MRRLICLATFMLFSMDSSAGTVAQENLTAFLRQQETQLDARIGMSVVNASGKPLVGYRQNERFPLTSTFKVLACAALLDHMHHHNGSMEERVTIQPEALLEYAPVTKNYLAPSTITLDELCAAAVSYSDNTAANLILSRLGGPDAVTRFMRATGDTVTRLDRNEPTLNEAIPGDKRDTSTPEKMASGLYNILSTPVLAPEERRKLDTWMREDKVADKLLRASLPQGWDIGDKTGAGGYGSRAIIAAVYPKGQPPFYVAIYITQTKATMKASDATIAAIGQRLFSGPLLQGGK